MPRTKTTQEFIQDARKIHGDKYDYSLVEYINSKTKLTIICKEHGEFGRIANDHLSGHGCQKCTKPRKSKEQFIQQAKKLHNNKYNYSKVEYVNNKTNVKIICTKHGEFLVSPNNHLQGKGGCRPCMVESYTSSTEEFIKKANKIHNNRYDYSKVVYVNNNTKVKIICSKHGIFLQTPSNHLQCECPRCKTSYGELYIEKILSDNKITYITQHTFIDCKITRLLRFDFYLPDINTCIEYDGEQHFKPTYFGKRKGKSKDKIHKLALEEFATVKLRDNFKNKYCKENNINIIRIRYDENIENKLNIIIS